MSVVFDVSREQRVGRELRGRVGGGGEEEGRGRARGREEEESVSWMVRDDMAMDEVLRCEV